MEFFLQQEGSFGTILFLGALLAGLLYLILPIFAWRIWYWSRQNSKHLQDISTKLELLIREIAPDALPAAEPVVPEADAPTEEQGLAGATAAALTEDDDSFFAEDDLQGDFSDGDDLDFSMSDDFDDVSDDIANSEISDFTDTETESLTDTSDDDDELVMDFDEESDDEESETADEETAGDEPADDEDELGSAFTETPASLPDEIPVAAFDSSEFTVEHFESNEESTFEFEDVDDSSFGIPSDTFDEDEFSLGDLSDDKEEVSRTVTAPAEDEPSTESIWGDEQTPPKAAHRGESAGDDEFSLGGRNDVGSAFDEPAAGQEAGVGETANSFLSELEDKLNLGTLSQPAPTPRQAPEPLPEPAAAPKAAQEPAENQATLFARCEGCGHKLAYKQALSGKRVRCPACRTAFSLP